MLNSSLPDRDWIAAHIPHQGAMCLLDRVESWDAEQIQCLASSHRSPDNPLRSRDRLGSACGIEYAAQAMAVHGALRASNQPSGAGYLVSVRGVKLHVSRLDDIEADLTVIARCITFSENNLLYQFEVLAEGRLLLEGRAAVVLDALSARDI
jgi:predicted hotdog family 3-hydroxylacyl-ACP dehydratase